MANQSKLNYNCNYESFHNFILMGIGDENNIFILCNFGRDVNISYGDVLGNNCTKNIRQKFEGTKDK